MIELAVRKDLRFEDITMGVIGVGNVGTKVAMAARILGMRVILNDPPRERKEGRKEFVSLDTIKKESEIITFHVPLNMEGEDKSFKMANESFFNTLSKQVYLLNTSRGPVVDEHSLLKAMNNGKVKGCILDVWENEPDINPVLVSKTEFATPHVAGYSTDGKANGTSMSVQAVSRFFGLGKETWVPENIPVPANANLTLNCSDLSEFEILRKVYSETYCILDDDTRLRNDLSKFEENRGSYRLRREPGAFSVQLINNRNKDLKNMLQQLGFTIVL
jgi:erythronate-4-phosphate dehydrogenase